MRMLGKNKDTHSIFRRIERPCAGIISCISILKRSKKNTTLSVALGTLAWAGELGSWGLQCDGQT